MPDTDANLGPITVPGADSPGNARRRCGETVNLTSNATGTYIFNTASGASTPTGATSVTIPSGQSSVTFFYGEHQAGDADHHGGGDRPDLGDADRDGQRRPRGRVRLANPGTQRRASGSPRPSPLSTPVVTP